MNNSLADCGLVGFQQRANAEPEGLIADSYTKPLNPVKANLGILLDLKPITQ